MANEWYAESGGNQYGPFSSSQLMEMIRQGKIQATTRVRQSTDAKWILASEVNGLFSAAEQSRNTFRYWSMLFATWKNSITNNSEIGGIPKWVWKLMGAVAVFLCLLILYAFLEGLFLTTRARIQTANHEVQQAVENAHNWIQNGLLSDADRIERELDAAGKTPRQPTEAPLAP